MAVNRRRFENLLTTTSVAALLIGAAEPALAGSCTAVTANFLNASTITCVTVTNTSFTGDVANFGTISAGSAAGTSTAVRITGSTITGHVIDLGTIRATNGPGIAIDGTSLISGGGSAINVQGSTFTGGIVNNGTLSDPVGVRVGATTAGVVLVSTFSGGIRNGGTIVGADNGIWIGAFGTFTGGISNSGAISASNDGILINTGSSFTGGITNSGTISGFNAGIFVFTVSTFTGGISNSGTISAANVGIVVGATTVGGPGVPSFSGGITNTGTITGGIGILFRNTAGVSVFDSGTIIGASGTAIAFNAGTNTMTLGPGWTITGNVVGTGSDVFQLGGSGAGTFNLSLLGTQFTGFRTFDVVGATWDATGSDAGFTGNVTIAGGNLIVGTAASPNATLGGSLVTVDTGSTLSGHGTILGSVVNAGGVVAPGGTIGTLTVGGNYTQGPSSTLSIEVSPAAASKLAVGGAASLNGTLALVYDPGVYSAKTYDIVHAGKVTGTFSTVTGSAPGGIAQSVLYSPTDVDLVLGAGTPLIVAPTNDTVYVALRDAALESGQEANAAVMGRLAGMQSGSLGTSAAGSDTTDAAAKAPPQLAMAAGANTGDNTAQIAALAADLPDAMARLGGWFQGVGEFANYNGFSTPGFSARSGGFIAGLDRPVIEHAVVGIAIGYSHTDLGVHDGESGTIETPRLMFYGSYDFGRWALDASAGYAYEHIGARRPIAALGEAAASNHDGHEATGALQATTRLGFDGITVTPAAGLDYVHLAEAGFEESGAPGFDLDGARRNSDSLRPFVGVSAAEPFTTASGVRIIPEADARYSHELFNTVPSAFDIGGGHFIVDGLTPSHDALTLGGGVTAAMTDRLALYADYHATLPTGNLLEQTVGAGLSYRF
jgi:fibronectin-binding autotransporter adhesin